MKKFRIFFVFVFVMSIIVNAIPLRDKVFDLYVDEIKRTLLFHDNGLFELKGEKWERCGGWDFRRKNSDDIDVNFSFHGERFSGSLNLFGIVKGLAVVNGSVKHFMAIENKNYAGNMDIK